ncbi:putative spermidine/putrescine transport system substrate-binding protein [Rhodoligotrophos appendicifer]|uniref:ABC transporter substrate-binding protein n=1 Tax=Rhodoligotrophos appendicifer TaxID=987056 RepID=UPI0011859C2A|nr:ABC transporter substrate-binding protein [Rhodoligotrophos appendicifer]
MITRRQTLGGIATLAALAGSGVRTTSAAGGEMVFCSWGGTTQEGQAKAWIEPFMAETGAKVLQDGPVDYGKLVAQVESGNVQWDVCDVEQDFSVFAGEKGLLEPLDWNVINKADLDPRFVNDYAVGSFYYAFILAYNKDSLGSAAPATWADMFDLKAFPGKRGYYKWAGPGVYEIPLLADGVAPDKLYPLDVDRALAKLDTIKSEIIFWGSGAASQQSLHSGETPLGMFWSSRIHFLTQDGANIGVGWDQNVTAADMLVIPKGSKNKDLAMKFLALASSAKGQADMAKLLAYNPTNTKSMAMLDAETRKYLPSEHSAQTVPLDVKYWAANRDELGKRWYDWQAK